MGEPKCKKEGTRERNMKDECSSVNLFQKRFKESNLWAIIKSAAFRVAAVNSVKVQNDQ